MNDTLAPDPEDIDPAIASSWWCAGVGDLLVWARLQVLESGIAEVLDSSGG